MDLNLPNINSEIGVKTHVSDLQNEFRRIAKEFVHG